MKFIVDKDSIIEEISVAHEIISSKNALSILSNVLLELKDDELIIKATNLKIGYISTIKVQVIQPGQTTVFCDKLLNILRNCPDGEIEFVLNENILNINLMFKKINFKLRTIESDKFPEIQDLENQQYFTFPKSDFLDMIINTNFAICEDESRLFMTGAFLETNEKSLSMVGTDGKRLAFIEKSSNLEIPQFDGIIIPPKALNLLRHFSSGEGDFNIAVNKTNLFVKSDNRQIYTNLIEGQFPNYQKVIPESQEYDLLMDRKALLEGVKRVSVLVEHKAKRMYIFLSENSIKIDSDDNEIGKAEEEIPCEYQGPEMTFVVNYQYFLDPLRIIDTEKVRLHFTDEKKPMTLYSEPRSDFFHIIMPMN